MQALPSGSQQTWRWLNGLGDKAKWVLKDKQEADSKEGEGRRTFGHRDKYQGVNKHGYQRNNKQNPPRVRGRVPHNHRPPPKPWLPYP